MLTSTADIDSAVVLVNRNAYVLLCGVSPCEKLRRFEMKAEHAPGVCQATIDGFACS